MGDLADWEKRERTRLARDHVQMRCEVAALPAGDLIRHMEAVESVCPIPADLPEEVGDWPFGLVAMVWASMQADAGPGAPARSSARTREAVPPAPPSTQPTFMGVPISEEHRR